MLDQSRIGETIYKYNSTDTHKMIILLDIYQTNPHSARKIDKRTAEYTILTHVVDINEVEG